MRAEIRQIVDRVDVLPSGHLVLDIKEADAYSMLGDLKKRCARDGLSKDETELEIAKAKAILDRQFGPRNKIRGFVIYFKNGNKRLIGPDGTENPDLVLRSEFLSGEKEFSPSLINEVINEESFLVNEMPSMK